MSATDSPSGDSPSQSKRKSEQEKRAAEAAKVAAGGKSTVQTRFTPRGGGESSQDIPPGAYSYASQAPQRSLVKAGDGFLTSGTGDNKSVVRGSTPEERRAQSSGGGNDRPSATAKATAEKPAEPTISPEEQEQQRIAAEIRAKRRRVAGYRSLLSPTRNDNLSSTLGGGGSV